MPRENAEHSDDLTQSAARSAIPIFEGSQARRSRWIAANDLANADFLDDASGDVKVRVHFKRRKRGNERVEHRGECRGGGFDENRR